MAPGTATCEGGLDAFELRVQSLRGALLPGSRGLDASLVASGVRRAWDGLVLGYCFFPVAHRVEMGEIGQAGEANLGSPLTAPALAVAWAMCTSRFRMGPPPSTHFLRRV